MAFVPDSGSDMTVIAEPQRVSRTGADDGPPGPNSSKRAGRVGQE
jgi:hypothetical protein